MNLHLTPKYNKKDPKFIQLKRFLPANINVFKYEKSFGFLPR